MLSSIITSSSAKLPFFIKATQISVMLAWISAGFHICVYSPFLCVLYGFSFKAASMTELLWMLYGALKCPALSIFIPFEKEYYIVQNTGLEYPIAYFRPFVFKNTAFESTSDSVRQCLCGVKSSGMLSNMVLWHFLPFSLTWNAETSLFQENTLLLE